MNDDALIHKTRMKRRVIFGVVSCVAFFVASCGRLDSSKTEIVDLHLEEVRDFSVKFTGHLNVSASDVSFTDVYILWSDEATFDIASAKLRIVSLIDPDQSFSIVLPNLKADTEYHYCYCVKLRSGVEVYGEVLSFKTLLPLYDKQTDLDIASAIDLSSSGSANCYIISESGLYKFRTTKGNSQVSVGNVVSASMIWETFGTSVAPEKFDLISGFCYKDGFIVFKTSDSFKEGNALLAAKDAKGEILWSWHIWFTDQPKEQVYFNNAGILMDRNIGATSATPGDVGALGLMYQWGRKDPFLGSSTTKFEDFTYAESTITWPAHVYSDLVYGTIEYTIAHPTTLILQEDDDKLDWYYSNIRFDEMRWLESTEPKTIYDPCPAGWRVPDGGVNGVWAKAIKKTSSFSCPYDTKKTGVNFSGMFGDDPIIWYPATGYLVGRYRFADGPERAEYWSATKSSYGWVSSFYYRGRSAEIQAWIGCVDAVPVRCSRDTYAQ